MKTYRFTIPCLDGKRRFVFCRSMNSVDRGSDGTGTSIIATERKGAAYTAYSPEQAEKDLAYFTEHSHGLKVEIAA